MCHHSNENLLIITEQRQVVSNPAKQACIPIVMSVVTITQSGLIHTEVSMLL
jgi:hypothetical protein